MAVLALIDLKFAVLLLEAVFSYIKQENQNQPTNQKTQTQIPQPQIDKSPATSLYDTA